MPDGTLNRRGFMTASAALGLGIAMPAVVRAQSYPTRPIKLVVGNAAGGSNDSIARLLGPIMSKKFGQPVTVENKPGAAGNIGLGLVANAPPDGHTLLVSSSVMLASSHTHTHRAVDPLNDLAHVSMICDGFFTFVINTAVPADTLAELVALARSEPNKLKFGTPGAGGNIHLAGELFKQRNGIQMKAVHYNGPGLLMADLLANEIQMGIAGLPIVGPHIKEGKLRPLFVAGKARERDMPDIPTSVELGLKDFDSITNWFGLHAPKGTPPAIIDRLQDAVADMVKDPVVVERLRTTGMHPVGDRPADFAARLAADDKVFAEAARVANIRVG